MSKSELASSCYRRHPSPSSISEDSGKDFFEHVHAANRGEGEESDKSIDDVHAC